MRISTQDPVSNNEVTDIDDAPFVIEGSGADAAVIYFESELNKAAYLDVPVELSDSMLSAIYAMLTRMLEERLADDSELGERVCN